MGVDVKSDKTIYFRVDGNDIIATGHVMRCMSIAAQVKKLGMNAVFVTADDFPRELIESNGFSVDVIGTVWNDLEKETEVLCGYVTSHNVEVLVIDSYYVTQDYLERLSAITKIVYVDDLFKFAYPVHTVLNHSVFANDDGYRELYIGENVPNLLVGGEYIPLREEFSDINRKVSPEVKNVLITTGGTDILNVAGNILKAVDGNEQLMSCVFHVIVGCFNNNKDKLRSIAERSGEHIILHENVNDMSYWMVACDAAISASGSTLYELCACGTPTICVEVADNQKGADNWEKGGYMLYAGNAANNMDECVKECIDKLILYNNNFEKREQMSIKMRELVDGKGAERVAMYIADMINV